MPTVTFLLGLCGSGKTVLANQLHQESGARIFESLVGRKTYGELKQCLDRGEDCIVEEIAFCFPENRQEIQQYLATVVDLQINWVCLENDIESANWNVDHRTNKKDPEGHKRLNERVHAHYVYPVGAEIRPIVRKTDATDDLDLYPEW